MENPQTGPLWVSRRLVCASRHRVARLLSMVVVGFVFGGWDAAGFVEQPPAAEPVDPFQGGVFEVVEPLPWPQVADEPGVAGSAAQTQQTPPCSRKPGPTKSGHITWTHNHDPVSGTAPPQSRFWHSNCR